MRFAKLMPLFLILICSGCASDGGAIEDACSIFPEPYWSKRDTPETQKWAEGYAVKYLRLCGG